MEQGSWRSNPTEQVTLDNSLNPVILSKTTQLDGGNLILQNGSGTIGPVNVSGHGRITNNTFGTTLTIPSITGPANGGVTFINIGDVVLQNLNDLTPRATPFRPRLAIPLGRVRDRCCLQRGMAARLSPWIRQTRTSVRLRRDQSNW
jgi:hypothetical protein